MAVIYLDITGDDRLALEARIQGNQLNALRLKRQIYQRTSRVVTDIKGFEPFNTGEWMTLVKYDNWRGEAVKDALRPTPASFSPLGIHVKEQWGYLDPFALLERVFEDLKSHWQKDYINYGTLPGMAPSRVQHFERNLPFVADLARYIVHDRTILDQVRPDSSVMPLPLPGQDDWLIEENTTAMNRTEKVALRGRLSIEKLGTRQIITHRPRVEGEDIVKTAAP
ncbi:MAG: hypothetical protein ACO1RX_17865 [Candidatus Sericytochromatia bacterium]